MIDNGYKRYQTEVQMVDFENAYEKIQEEESETEISRTFA